MDKVGGDKYNLLKLNDSVETQQELRKSVVSKQLLSAVQKMNMGLEQTVGWGIAKDLILKHCSKEDMLSMMKYPEISDYMHNNFLSDDKSAKNKKAHFEIILNELGITDEDLKQVGFTK